MISVNRTGTAKTATLTAMSTSATKEDVRSPALASVRTIGLVKTAILRVAETSHAADTAPAYKICGILKERASAAATKVTEVRFVIFLHPCLQNPFVTAEEFQKQL